MIFPARIFLLATWVFLLTACAYSPASISSPRYKLFVSEDGFHRVSGAALQSAGVDVEKMDATTLQLYRGDREVAIRVQGEGKNLALDFYGQASNSPYSAYNVYWLTWGAQSGKRMREIDLAESTSAPRTMFDASIRLAPARVYAPQVGATNSSWFWQLLNAPMTTTIPITLPGAMPDQARLRVSVQGNSDDAGKPNHHLRVFFNDIPVADETWSGRASHSFAVTIPATVVREGANTVRLVAPGDTRAIADVVLLSSIEMSYTRRLIAQNDALEFGASQGTHRVEGFNGEAIELYDITDPGEPRRVANAHVASGALTFVSGDSASRRWLALSSSAPRFAPHIAPMPPTNLRAIENQADYVIITHAARDFVNALQPLVEWRAKRGLRVRVVTTNEIYDEFNYGAESPNVLRAFLDFTQREWSKPAPRFVLLVGKASYDYRDVLNAPNKNLLPTFLVDTLNSEKNASDNQFAATSQEDIRPAFAIGRIPAKTPDQVARVVSKIIAYESGARTTDWRARAIFVADDKAPDFTLMSDALAARLPAGMQTRKIYLAGRSGDVKSARADLIAQWNAGASLVTYVGHGSVDLWATGPLFGPMYLGEIRNGERLPILFTPTCLDGFFYHPLKDSLAEELLFKSDGGIIAGIVPTGISFSSAQSELMHALFGELFERAAPTLGEGLTRAKQKLDADSPAVREVIETFVLLGDPALAWRVGD
ncbi:MAG: hypothetical protein HY868_16090 [Chloroflexi bacterium]|nr:hypothetical protein [Chloroflexota bacterium]